ncbi:hypothetical protein BJ508DRAFT_414322 [Ascobolus immersus RN42]|uniref:Uncharacterized protein n=1 Tax=Ascobolus immersus RN42 TaxID=1160509 RepID=A0A3N4IBM7_ASCIM|nr:hypothetical protein BJ508DRAFT_414322 [Ascobolus immersus RN42]
MPPSTTNSSDARLGRPDYMRNGGFASSSGSSTTLLGTRTPCPGSEPSKNITTSSTLAVDSSPSYVNPLQGTTGYPLDRFLFRACIGVAAPITVTAFYICICGFYLFHEGANSENPTNVNHKYGSSVFYVWFAVAAVGMNLSRYGLQGAEASLLMHEKLAPKNALELLMHCDISWAGPGGWWRTARNVIQRSQEELRRRFSKIWGSVLAVLGLRTRIKEEKGRETIEMPSLLWWALMLISMLAFIALPLSGLTMELGDGYQLSDRNPVVSGRDYWTFNQRLAKNNIDSCHSAWTDAATTRLPGIGIVYTSHTSDKRRKDYPFLVDIPSSFPKDDGVPDIFLTAQGETPIKTMENKKSWGLRIRYNCTTVSSRSELPILARYIKNENKTALQRLLLAHPNNEKGIRLDVPGTDQDGSKVLVNSYWRPAGRRFKSMFSQLAISDFEGFGIQNETKQYRYYTHSTGPYQFQEYNKEHTMEFLLYQFHGNLSSSHPKLFENYMQTKIDDLDGEYVISRSLENNTQEMAMTAIGVRCSSSSEVGLASLDIFTSSFRNFERSDTARFQFYEKGRDGYDVGAIPFSFGPAAVLLSAGNNMISSIISSTHSGLQDFQAKETERDPVPELAPLLPFSSTLLRRSFLSLYANYAKVLMYHSGLDVEEDRAAALYPGGEVPTSETRKLYVLPPDASRLDSMYFHSFKNLNVTGSISTTVMKKGPIGFGGIIAIMVLFILWMLGSLVLSRFGFKRRWAEILDGFSMLRFGADFSNEIHAGKAEFHKTSGYESCNALQKMPGLVGDSADAEWSPGHISLIQRNAWRAIPKGRKFA